MVTAYGKETATKPLPQLHAGPTPLFDLQASAGDLSSSLAPPTTFDRAAPPWSVSPMSSQSRFFHKMGLVTHPSALAATPPAPAADSHRIWPELPSPWPLGFSLPFFAHGLVAQPWLGQPEVAHEPTVASDIFMIL
jgi:hypothetical protein